MGLKRNRDASLLDIVSRIMVKRREMEMAFRTTPEVNTVQMLQLSRELDILIVEWTRLTELPEMGVPSYNLEEGDTSGSTVSERLEQGLWNTSCS